MTKRNSLVKAAELGKVRLSELLEHGRYTAIEWVYFDEPLIDETYFGSISRRELLKRIFLNNLGSVLFVSYRDYPSEAVLLEPEQSPDIYPLDGFLDYLKETSGRILTSIPSSFRPEQLQWLAPKHTIPIGKRCVAVRPEYEITWKA